MSLAPSNSSQAATMLYLPQTAPEFWQGLLQRSTVILHPFWVDLAFKWPSYDHLKMLWCMQSLQPPGKRRRQVASGLLLLHCVACVVTSLPHLAQLDLVLSSPS